MSKRHSNGPRRDVTGLATLVDESNDIDAITISTPDHMHAAHNGCDETGQTRIHAKTFDAHRS